MNKTYPLIVELARQYFYCGEAKSGNRYRYVRGKNPCAFCGTHSNHTKCRGTRLDGTLCSCSCAIAVEARVDRFTLDQINFERNNKMVLTTH